MQNIGNTRSKTSNTDIYTHTLCNCETNNFPMFIKTSCNFLLNSRKINVYFCIVNFHVHTDIYRAYKCYSINSIHVENTPQGNLLKGNFLRANFLRFELSHDNNAIQFIAVEW